MNKIINSIIAGLLIVIITFIGMVFLIKVNVYSNFTYQRIDNQYYIKYADQSDLEQFIKNNKAHYLLGYHKNSNEAIKFNIDENQDNTLILTTKKSINESVGTISFYLGKSVLYQHLIKSINL
ncbi:hypothetical protein [Mycoplasma sp. E35C]|uniref:hypothetical protein n=1 Tax=Mycoplasma sp. E35C TaxID=2801918 RepID=UPI001CA3A811|nr:hypothetical protein [Mycoplasma sp. E35C]QZX48840.1 hypothetical protein JJE79_02145 [Mycoplasma sp. E35C]